MPASPSRAGSISSTANSPAEPHAIHGQGWQHPWTVREAGERAAVLEFAHRVAGTPLDYRARQSFALAADRLTVTLELANTGRAPMPAGLGLHPYFPRSEAVTLRARLDHVWRADGRKLPQERAAPPAAWDFGQAARVAALALDNCFGGWDGTRGDHLAGAGSQPRDHGRSRCSAIW